jgi:hypothetical protein
VWFHLKGWSHEFFELCFRTKLLPLCHWSIPQNISVNMLFKSRNTLNSILPLSQENWNLLKNSVVSMMLLSQNSLLSWTPMRYWPCIHIQWSCIYGQVAMYLRAFIQLHFGVYPRSLDSVYMCTWPCIWFAWSCIFMHMAMYPCAHSRVSTCRCIMYTCQEPTLNILDPSLPLLCLDNQRLLLAHLFTKREPQI